MQRAREAPRVGCWEVTVGGFFAHVFLVPQCNGSHIRYVVAHVSRVDRIFTYPFITRADSVRIVHALEATMRLSVVFISFFAKRQLLPARNEELARRVETACDTRDGRPGRDTVCCVCYRRRSPL